MAFPSGWTRKAPITIPAGKVAGSGGVLFNFPVLLTEATLPIEMFASDGLSPAQNGGGDIRFTSDEAGTNAIPLEVVSFVTDPDPSNGAAELWVRVPSLDKGADTTIWVWWNTTGTDSQPTNDDPLGRDAVWAATHLARWHFDSVNPVEDVSGNGYDLDMSNVVLDGSKIVAGPWGNALALGQNEWIYASQVIPTGTADDEIALSIWVKYPFPEAFSNAMVVRRDAGGNVFRRFRLGGDSANNQPQFETRFGAFSTRVITVGASLPADMWKRWDGHDSDGEHVHFIDGVEIDRLAQLDDFATDYRIIFGAKTIDGAESSSNFHVAEAGLRLTTDPDWIATEYNNQSDPPGFALAGTVQDIGGIGGDIAATMSATAAGTIAEALASLRHTGSAEAILGRATTAADASIRVRGSVSSGLSPISAALQDTNAVNAQGAVWLASILGAGIALARLRAAASLMAPVARSDGVGRLRSVATSSTVLPAADCGAAGSVPITVNPTSQRQLIVKASARTRKALDKPRRLDVVRNERKIT